MEARRDSRPLLPGRARKPPLPPKTPHPLSGIYSENARWEIQIEPRWVEQKTKLASHIGNLAKSKAANGATGPTADCFQSFSLTRSFSPRAPSPQTPRCLLAHSPECYSVSLRSKNAAAFSKQMALAISSPNSFANSACSSPTRSAGSSQLGTSQPS